MAERTFDYEKIAEVYKSMQTITGDAGSPDSLAGTLHLADKEMEDKVGVELQALYGPLANQLTLDWQNFSSNFPNFVNNFNNWAAAVSKAAGDYSEFEARIQQMRADNPLGVASDGATNNHIETSYYQTYADANIEQFQVDVANFEAKEIYDLTGAYYSLASATERLKKHKTQAIVEDVFLAAGAAICLYSAGSLVASLFKPTAPVPSNPTPPSPGTELVPVNPGGTPAVTAPPGWTGTPGGTPLLGNGGGVMPIDTAISQASASGNPALASLMESAKASGCTNLVADSTGTLVQAIDGSGHVMYTWTAGTQAASATSTMSSAASAASTMSSAGSAASGTAEILSSTGEVIGTTTFSETAATTASSAASHGSAATRLWAAMRGAGAKAGTVLGDVAGKAGAAKDAAVGFMKTHKVATALGAAGIVAAGSAALNNK
ncbi:MAG: hypothetical protein II625_05350 [Bacilli bacterium]|nr:hypothetical protein [Bacilli bacterium]